MLVRQTEDLDVVTVFMSVHNGFMQPDFFGTWKHIFPADATPQDLSCDFPRFEARKNKEENRHVLLMLLAFITQQD